MEYKQAPTDYNAKTQTLSEQIRAPKEGIELLVNSATRLKEHGKENLEYGIEACACPCPCPCITKVEGTIIKVSVYGGVFTGVSVVD